MHDILSIQRKLKNVTEENEWDVYEDFYHLDNICLSSRTFTSIYGYTSIEPVDRESYLKLWQHQISRINSTKRSLTSEFLTKASHRKCN